MGNSNSSENNHSEGNGNVPIGYFGVRVTGDAMKDVLANEHQNMTENMNQKIQKAFNEAYEKGNQETLDKFTESFQNMGQETYVQYMDAIKEIHTKEYEDSKGIMGTLETKLSVPAPDPQSRVCAPEEKDLIKCMESGSIVDCKSFSDHYSLCVQQSLKS